MHVNFNLASFELLLSDYFLLPLKFTINKEVPLLSLIILLSNSIFVREKHFKKRERGKFNLSKNMFRPCRLL